MVPETGLGVLSALLLAASGLIGTVDLIQGGAPRSRLLLSLRLAAAVALAAALALAAIGSGGWSPTDLRQATLAVALAALIVQLLLAWRCRIDGAAPVVDLAALGLVLLGLFGIWTGRPPPSWAQRALPYRAAWLLLLLGSGSAVVAGSAGLRIGLRSRLTRARERTAAALGAGVNGFLGQATMLALGLLGSGLLANGWWSWQAVGRLSIHAGRDEWLAAAWLLAAASLIAWRLGRGRRWAAALAVAAAAAVLVGLLVVVDLRRWLGIAA